jgi:hypothetical protein
MGASSRGSVDMRSLTKRESNTHFVPSPCNRGVGGLMASSVLPQAFVPLPDNLYPCFQALVVAHTITSVAKGCLSRA